jgi:hypothetical protein
MEGDFLERVIVIVALVWAASALLLAWLARLSPVAMGRTAYFSLLLVASALFAASTIALGGIWTAPVAVVSVAIIAYFAIRRR